MSYVLRTTFYFSVLLVPNTYFVETVEQYRQHVEANTSGGNNYCWCAVYSLELGWTEQQAKECLEHLPVVLQMLEELMCASEIISG